MASCVGSAGAHDHRYVDRLPIFRSAGAVILVVGLVSMVGGAPPASEKSTIQVELRAGDRPVIVVSGLTEAVIRACRQTDFDEGRWRRLMAVRVGSDAADEVPMLLGSYRVERQDVVFEPRFPLRPGLSYRVVVDPSRVVGADLDESTKAVVHVVRLPAKPKTSVARVLQVYPTTDKIPQNLLKFYFHFSDPMSRGDAYRRIHLHRVTAEGTSGEEVVDPFLELGEELWDPSGRRFTLLFDPGRIKRGLKPNEELGTPLEVGKTYDLIVDAAWSDEDGRPLKSAFRKRFQVVPADRRQPDPDLWKIVAPTADTRDPLIVRFREPLDQAMLVRVLTVYDSKQDRVLGEIEISDGESRWEFRPKTAWSPGRYRLQCETTLEDMAGNSIGRPFEVDLSKVDEDAAPIEPLISKSFVVE